MSLKFEKTLKISFKINASKCVGQNVKNGLNLTKKRRQNLSKSSQNSTPKISSKKGAKKGRRRNSAPSAGGRAEPPRGGDRGGRLVFSVKRN